jgi:hypothetical protein
MKVFYIPKSILAALVLNFSAICNGIRLGLHNRMELHQIDQSFYDRESQYQAADYNSQGLWAWEQAAIAQHFSACRTLWLAGCGGRREVLALHQLGYQVDAFECHPQFVAFANQFLPQFGYPGQVQLAPRDACPASDLRYDGLVVGWGVYMLIQGRQTRIQFLQQLRSRVNVGAPILLSFFHRYHSDAYFNRIAKTGNLLRCLRRSALIEAGDILLPWNFVHYFTPAEIQTELAAAGFDLVFYDHQEYGHAVALAQPIAPSISRCSHSLMDQPPSTLESSRCVAAPHA